MLLVLPAVALTGDEVVGVAAERCRRGDCGCNSALSRLDGVDPGMSLGAMKVRGLTCLLQADLGPRSEAHFPAAILSLHIQIEKPSPRTAGLYDEVEPIAVGVPPRLSVLTSFAVRLFVTRMSALQPTNSTKWIPKPYVLPHVIRWLAAYTSLPEATRKGRACWKI